MFARETLVTAKQRLKAGNWCVVYGIVCFIWVTPDPDINDDNHEDIDALCDLCRERVQIQLENKTHYDWVTFVPHPKSDAGALTKCFGKVTGDGEFKIRGINARQRLTPSFVGNV